MAVYDPYKRKPDAETYEHGDLVQTVIRGRYVLTRVHLVVDDPHLGRMYDVVNMEGDVVRRYGRELKTLPINRG